MLKFENLKDGDRFTANINFESNMQVIEELTYRGKSETGLHIGLTGSGERFGFYDFDIIDITHVEKKEYEM
jgi:hypothetical protein